MMKKLSRNSLLALFAVGIAACSSVNVDDVLPDKAVEYKREPRPIATSNPPPDPDL